MQQNGNLSFSKPKILIVDDRAENLYVLNKLLSRLDLEVVQALSGPEALTCVLDGEYCVAIIDIQMPEMDGYELVEMLRSNLLTTNLPVIFVSAIYSDEYHHRKAYEKGAVDFLSKPYVPEILLSKVKVFIDLFQQRQAVNQANITLQQANEALHEANAEKDKLFSIISHDLRAPFNIILGFTQLMEIQAAMLKPGEVEEMARTIHSGAKTAYALLDNLLTWSRLQREKGYAVRPEPFDVAKLAGEAIEVYQQTSSAKNITLTNQVEPEVKVVADRQMIDTILRNLTGNAIKFTPRGGQITILNAQDGANPSPGMATIGVRDSGVGMSAEVQAKLFRLDIHHTTPGTEQEAGSGLGLVICQDMVERNGGKIWVESEVGKGTTFWFTIPCEGKG